MPNYKNTIYDQEKVRAFMTQFIEKRKSLHSQSELAGMLGVSKNTILHFVSGLNNNISDETINKFFDLLNHRVVGDFMIKKIDPIDKSTFYKT